MTMRVSTRVLLLCSVFCVLASRGFAQEFEGTLTMQMSSPMFGGNPIPITISMKGEKSVSVSSTPFTGEMKIYSDRATMKTVTVMGGKLGYETDLNKAAASGGAQDSIVPVATGQKNTINGYACELYTISMKEGEMDLWMTADFPKEIKNSLSKSFSGAVGGMRAAKGGATGAFSELMAKGLAPVETIMKKDGQVMMTMDFVKYEKKPIDDAVFVIPSDVNIQPAPQMPGGH